MKYTRRQFIGLMSATAAGTGLYQRITSGLASLTALDDTWQDRTEKRILSICQMCPGGCGLSVRAVAGMPVKVDGNRLYPINHGALCPRGQAMLQSLYNPDRFIGPLRRVGPKGSGQWQQLTWEEALQTLAESLSALRAKGKPEALAIWGGNYRGLLQRLWSRFAQAYGTPNYIRLRTFNPEAPDPAVALMQGQARPAGFDLREAALVLSLGCNWLESWNAPVYQMQAYGHMRQGRRGRRAEIIHVEPRLSPSAAKADLWVPLAPGTEGIFALGLAHLLVREQSYDEEFVGHSTFGFEDWTDAEGRKHIGFKRMVIEEYPPGRVAERTGVRLEVLVKVARSLASVRPAVVLGENRSLLEGHDLFTRLAIHSLNALVGSIGVTGGILPGQEEPPLIPWPDVGCDQTAQQGLASRRLDGAGAAEHFLESDAPGQLPSAILAGANSPVEVLFLQRANPLYGRPDKKLFGQALARIPLVVSFSGMPDEVSAQADLILPEHHFLEGWQDDQVSFLPSFTLFGIGQPAVKPLYNTRHPADVILDLARRMGPAIAPAFPWTTYAELLKQTAKGLFDQQRGYVIATEATELFRQVLQRNGYRSAEFGTFEEFWQALIASGGWWDPHEPVARASRRFGTPSGRFEFYPQLLQRRLKEAFAQFGDNQGRGVAERARILSALGMADETDDLFFPRVLLARAPVADPKFPFWLQTFELLTIGDGIGANLPDLQENLAVHVKESWESWAEIHPQTARKLGIHDGSWVWVESPHGRVRLRARLYPGTRPEVIAMPVGQGHKAGGRWAQNRGCDPSDLMAPRSEHGNALLRRDYTQVRIYPAEGG